MLQQLALKFAQADYQYGSYGSDPATTSASVSPVVWAIYVVVIIFLLGCLWKIFEKAGRPGWAAIVPVYNNWVMYELGGKPGWLALLAFVPIVNIYALVMYVLAALEISKRFGKGGGFAALMILLPFIAYPMLALGNATYTVPGETPQNFNGSNGGVGVADVPQQPVFNQSQSSQQQQRQQQPPQPPTSNLV